MRPNVIKLSILALLMSSYDTSQACPRHKDEIFFTAKEKYNADKDAEDFLSRIDVSNGICVMEKLATKGELILKNPELGNMCEGIEYFEEAIIKNVESNYGEIIFNYNEEYALLFLNPFYNNAYFQISAIEGNKYSRYKVAKELVKLLDDNSQYIFGNGAKEYAKTIEEYLIDASNINSLRSEIEPLLKYIREKFPNNTSNSHIDTRPRKVICEP